MESKIEKFFPKYNLWDHIEPFVYLGVSAFLILFSMFVSTLPHGGNPWESTVYWIIAFPIAALYEASRMIKVVEFRDSEMIVRYYLRRKKAIGYREITGIEVEWSYIRTTRGRIYIGEMVNQDELEARVVDILRARQILDINLTEENRKTVDAVKKRLRYALVITIVIGLVAEFVGHADWSEFSIILFLYFILAYLVLWLFIK